MTHFFSFCNSFLQLGEDDPLPPRRDSKKKRDSGHLKVDGGNLKKSPSLSSITSYMKDINARIQRLKSEFLPFFVVVSMSFRSEKAWECWVFHERKQTEKEASGLRKFRWTNGILSQDMSHQYMRFEWTGVFMIKYDCEIGMPTIQVQHL